MNTELYRKLDLLIVSGNAGTVKMLAKKLGTEPRQIKHMINVLKNKYDCPIGYSAPRKSYYYTQPGHCVLGFQSSEPEKLLKEIQTLTKKFLS